MAKAGRGQTRRDSKRRVLRPGESVRADGKYQYKYHIDGKPHFVYSWKLEPTDKLPKGKKPCLSFRELEKQVNTDLDLLVNIVDGQMTVCELVDRYLKTKTEYHNNLTLEEAIKIYESIPAERLHGIKGIGFDLQDGDEDYSGEYELMSADRIQRDLIDMIPHYKESSLVQKAIADMEKYLDEKHGRVKETEHTAETVIGSGQKPSAVTADRRAKQEPVSVSQSQTQKAEPASRAKGEVKKSVLQSLKDFQAKAKAQEQNKTTEKSKTHKKGEVEL